VAKDAQTGRTGFELYHAGKPHGRPAP
jgi:hypothetical protein